MAGTRRLSLARPAAGTGALEFKRKANDPVDRLQRRTVYTRFRRWSRAGVWEGLFKELSADPDFEYVLIDATISKVHADASSQKGGLRLMPSAAPAAD